MCIEVFSRLLFPLGGGLGVLGALALARGVALGFSFGGYSDFSVSAIVLILILVLLAVLLVVGIVLTLLGVRGRCVDDHPLCGRCGFDLFGSSGSTRCPECGSELSAKVIRHGHREVRRRPLIVGLILGIPSFLLLAGLCIMVVRGTDLEPYKPFWMVLREGDSRAIAELNRREFIANSLSPDQERRLVAAALDVQGNPNRAWQPGQWGALIEGMRALGKVNDSEWRQYARQAAEFSVEIRPVVRRGDPMPIGFVHGQGRVERSRFHAMLRLTKRRIDDIDIGGGVPDNFNWDDEDCDILGFMNPWLFNAPVFPISTDPRHPIALGRHTFHCNLIVKIYEGEGTGHPPTTPPLATITKAVSLPITIVDQPTVDLVHDPALLPKLMATLSIKGPAYKGQPNTIAIDRNGMRSFVYFTNAPIGVDFDVSMRDASGREWKLYSSLDLPPHAPPIAGAWNIWGQVSGFAGDKADLILRPDRAAAEQTTYLTRIWGDEIGLHDVKISWAPGTPRPWRAP